MATVTTGSAKPSRTIFLKLALASSGLAWLVFFSLGLVWLLQSCIRGVEPGELGFGASLLLAALLLALTAVICGLGFLFRGQIAGITRTLIAVIGLLGSLLVFSMLIATAGALMGAW